MKLTPLLPIPPSRARARGQAKKSLVNRLKEVEIVVTDSSRLLCVVKYIVPALTKKCFRWLVKEARVKVAFGLVQHVDTPQEIVLLTRGDRTSVMPVVDPSTTSGISVDRRRQSTGAVKPRAGAGSALRRNQTQYTARRKTMGAISDGANFNHYPSVAADAKSTAGDMAKAAMQLRIAEEETRRWHAVKRSDSHFRCVLPQTRVESCVRSLRLNATVVMASPVELPSDRDPEPEGLSTVRVASNEGHMIELMIVATSLLEQTHRPTPPPDGAGGAGGDSKDKDKDKGDSLLMRLRSGESARVHLVISSHYDLADPTKDGSPKIHGSTVVHLEELL